MASEEQIFYKLSKQGFDVREGVCARVTKETCAHGDFVVPGRLSRALNPGIEKSFEDPSQRWGISKTIIITQKTLQVSFHLVLLPAPRCAGCPPATEGSPAGRQWGGGALLQVCLWTTCCWSIGSLLSCGFGFLMTEEEGGLHSEVTESFRRRVLTVEQNILSCSGGPVNCTYSSLVGGIFLISLYATWLL